MIKNYIIFDRTTGKIKEAGRVDVDMVPDGATVKERLDRLLLDSSLDIVYSEGKIPDPETKKINPANREISQIDFKTDPEYLEAQAKDKLQTDTTELFKLVLALWSVIKNHTSASNIDLPSDIQNKITEWDQLLKATMK